MTYRKVGNRISLLPISQYCGLAAKLSEAHGAGRPAAMSSAFHAKMAGQSDAAEKLARLTPEELETISKWKKPTPVTVMGKELTYDDAHKESWVGLSSEGEFSEEGDLITCGTADFFWTADHHCGFVDTILVADMKKSAWASKGPNSLQLLAYGYALAKRFGATSFCTGIWVIEDEEWVWCDEPHRMDDYSALDLWSRIKHAALNSGDTSFGDHCSDCYGRLHCPEYAAPAALADTVLSPVAMGQAIDGDIEKLTELVLYCQRVLPLIDKVYDTAKEAVRRGARIRQNGKEFYPHRAKGRERLNQSRLFAEFPEATKFMERGDPHDVFTWKKERP